MRRRSRAGGEPVKTRRRKTAARKRPGETKPARPRNCNSSAASQESEAARLASELSAMSEILRLISNSPSDLGTVLQSVAEQAAHLCQAQFVDIFLVENDNLRDVAWVGELKRTLAFPLDRSTVSGRSVCEMRPVSIDDLQNAGDEFARGARDCTEGWSSQYPRRAANPRRPSGWHHQSPPNGNPTVRAETYRSADQLRRPGGHRHREHAAVE
jgi:hypothetical protein